MGFAAIRAVAGYLPPQIEKNDMTDRAAQALGIEERHIATPEQAASDLAVQAADGVVHRYAIDDMAQAEEIVCFLMGRDF